MKIHFSIICLNINSNFCLVLLYLLQQVLAWNDCLFRARGESRYLALVDLDENFVTFNNQTLLSVLDETVNKDPHAGAFMFLSSFALFKVISQLFHFFFDKCN